jgi:hypothetical protein
MIIEMDIGNWHVELVVFAWMERHAVTFLGHVFPDEPYTSPYFGKIRPCW